MAATVIILPILFSILKSVSTVTTVPATWGPCQQLQVGTYTLVNTPSTASTIPNIYINVTYSFTWPFATLPRVVTALTKIHSKIWHNISIDLAWEYGVLFLSDFLYRSHRFSNISYCANTLLLFIISLSCSRYSLSLSLKCP